MRYALSEKNEKIEVMFSGQRAKCPMCATEVVGKKGKYKQKHWAHLKLNCDSWYEPTTEWHLEWQNYFPIENREITIKRDNKSHRADIELDNGMVIEVQNSPIKSSEIQKREAFYGLKNMIWILNGKSLARKTELRKVVFNYNYFFQINFPKLQKNRNYLSEKFLEDVIDYYPLDNVDDIVINPSKILYKSFKTNIISNESEIKKIRFYLASMYQNFYQYVELDNFRQNLSFEYGIKKKVKTSIFLDKNYWRLFIDEMRFPVFFDGISGMNEDEIYWYQKNKIFKKRGFFKKIFTTHKNWQQQRLIANNG